jgi:hypothetical protein
VADGPQSVIEKQVRNGVAIRMALIHRALGGPVAAGPPPPAAPRSRAKKQAGA